jgi:hypothetical protein
MAQPLLFCLYFIRSATEKPRLSAILKRLKKNAQFNKKIKVFLCKGYE